MATNFRGLYKYMVPSWLYEGEGEIVLHSLSLILDAATQRMRDGLTARFPVYAGDSALALIGRDRGIPRGRAETVAHYAARLTAWRYPRGHRTRGSAFALLEQVSEYFGGIGCWTIDANLNRHVRTADGTEAYSYGYPWEWDTQPASNWSRFWLVVDGPAMPADPVFEDVRAIRALFYGAIPWRPAGTQPEWMILQDAFGDIVIPAGDDWSRWSVNVAGAQLPLRWYGNRYWSLDPEHNNEYAGNPANFAAETLMADGTTYAGGDPTSFPASATLPSGATYAGDPTSFPVLVRLVDDGDLLAYD
jgi:hypothetical protein